MKFEKNILPVFLATALILTFTGCSPGSTPSKSTSSSSEEKVTVAVAQGAKPLSYTDQNGNLTGYEVEVIRAIDTALSKYQFDVVAASPDAEQVGIDTGKYAVIADGNFKTDERAAKYLIPDNIGISLTEIFTKSDRTDINSLADLKGKTLAPVPPAGGIYSLLSTYNSQHPDSQVSFQTAENVPIANRFKELQDGKYDALVWPSGNLDLNSIEQSLNTKFRHSDPVQISPTYLLINKKYVDLSNQINTAIAQLKKEGTLSTLSIKYFGEDVFKYQK